MMNDFLDNLGAHQYEKISREIDSVDDIDMLKTMCKCYVKLHMKQQEVTANVLKVK